MPLVQGKSKQSFSKNVGELMNAGHPQKQSLAIAYDIKRKNKKKMASGGEVAEQAPAPNPDPRAPNPDKAKRFMSGFGYAEGGEVNEKLHPQHEGIMNKHEMVAKKIMAKKMAEGGMVNEETESMDQLALDEVGAEDLFSNDDNAHDEVNGNSMNAEEEDPKKKMRAILMRIMGS